LCAYRKPCWRRSPACPDRVLPSTRQPLSKSEPGSLPGFLGRNSQLCRPLTADRQVSPLRVLKLRRFSPPLQSDATGNPPRRGGSGGGASGLSLRRCTRGYVWEFSAATGPALFAPRGRSGRRRRRALYRLERRALVAVGFVDANCAPVGRRLPGDLFPDFGSLLFADPNLEGIERCRFLCNVSVDGS
jgi:hypothetical protein